MTLCAAPDFGPVTITRLLAHFEQDAVKVLAADDSALRVCLTAAKIAKLRRFLDRFDAADHQRRLTERGARFVLRGEADYPPGLAQLSDAPPGLYVAGEAKFPAINLAIVGTRHASAYGRRIARTWAQRLAGAGVGIVSGLALGIDAEAHAGAMEAGGFTAAVLGGGLDIVYPPENRALRDQIIAQGLLLSEFHLGRRVDRQSFPQRNRLVSGMCDAVLVVESARRAAV